MKTKRMSLVCGALLAGMAMTGCGGGGGSEAPAPMAQAPQPEAPTPAPAPTGRHMHPGSVSVLFADWIGSKRAFVEAANGPSRLMPVGCNVRLQCGLNISGLPMIDLYEEGTGLRPSEGTERFPQSLGSYFPEGFRAGKGGGRFGETEVASMGFWNDWAEAALYIAETVHRGTAYTATIPVSFGDDADTDMSPDLAEAVYRGAMIGVPTEGKQRGEAPFGEGTNVIGPARFELGQYGYNSSAATLRFEDIRDTANPSGPIVMDPMVWKDIRPRNSRGEFEPDGSLKGNFFGPNHEAVGGVFERDGVNGVFMANR